MGRKARSARPWGVPTWNAYSYVFGPLLAAVALGVLVLILRWAFSRGSSVVAAPATPGRTDDYGLLVEAATPQSYIDGEMWRQKLEAEGVRANLATTLDGPRILVWPADVQRAQVILGLRAPGSE